LILTIAIFKREVLKQSGRRKKRNIKIGKTKTGIKKRAEPQRTVTAWNS